MRSKGLWIGVAAGLAVIVGVGITYGLIVRLVKMHYAQCYEVVPGVLYRCGRMRPDLFEAAVRKYRIRTLVDLRGDESAPGSGKETVAEWAVKHGLLYFNFGIHGLDTPQAFPANVILIATTPRCQPMLLHCHHGRVRTNVGIAFYRMTQQGWTPEQAYNEMIAFGLFPSEQEWCLKALRENRNFDWKKYATADPDKPTPVEMLKLRHP